MNIFLNYSLKDLYYLENILFVEGPDFDYEEALSKNEDNWE